MDDRVLLLLFSVAVVFSVLLFGAIDCIYR